MQAGRQRAAAAKTYDSSVLEQNPEGAASKLEENPTSRIVVVQ